MNTEYRPALKAHVTLDERRKVRHVRHSQEFWIGESNVPRLVANDYLKEMSEVIRTPREQLKDLDKKVSFMDPRNEQGVEYQLNEEKHLFDSATIGYYQTYKNVPVWRRGLSVKIKENPARVAGATNNSEDGIHGELPDAAIIERYKDIFRRITADNALTAAGLSPQQDEADTTPFLAKC